MEQCQYAWDKISYDTVILYRREIYLEKYDLYIFIAVIYSEKIDQNLIPL